MTRVGNQTNSADPDAINSRIFVGNLNTYLVAKEELENIFQRYGRIRGISMHKGYAFVQFTDTWDARNAVMGEDGRTVAGQILDVNMVLEPKPHQVLKKRANSQPPSPSPKNLSPRQMIPPLKRQRTNLPSFPLVPKSKPKLMKMEKPTPSLFQPIVYPPENWDILICGNCKELFSGLQKFMEHKMRTCKLRFTCKCHQNDNPPGLTTQICCAHCETKCATWLELIQHVQGSHGLSIYQHLMKDTNISTSDEHENGNRAIILTPSTSDSCDQGKETNSCSSDSQCGLVEAEWEVTSEKEQAAITAQITQTYLPQQNQDKAVDTADLMEQE